MKKLFEEIERSYHSGNLVLFVGAGVSIPEPSNIPDANNIKKIVIDSVRDGIMLPTNCIDELYTKLPTVGLENIISLIDIYAPGFVSQLMALLATNRQFNWMHSAIKLLSKKSGFCATTNFDLLLEEAVSVGHPGFVVVTNSSDLSSEATDPVLIKLHGTCDDKSLDRLGITLRTISANLNREENCYLTEVLKNKDLMVLGYRGRDVDVLLPISGGKGKVFWCWHSNDPEPIIDGDINDNPVAHAFCKSRPSIQFRCDSQELLKVLLSRTNLFSPQIPAKHIPNDDFRIRIREITLSISHDSRSFILGRLMRETGQLDQSKVLLSSIIIQREDIPITQRIESRLYAAENIKEKCNPNAFKEARHLLGEVSGDVSSLGNQRKASMYEAWSACIQGFMLQYEGKYDAAYQLTSSAVGKIKTIEGNVGRLEVDFYNYVLMRGLIEEGNSLYYQSRIIGDDYDKRLIQATSVYINLLYVAIEQNDIRMQAKSLENIAHTHNRWVFRCYRKGLTDGAELKFGSICRSIALNLLEFIGDTIAIGRTNINLAYDLNMTGEYGAAFGYSVDRLKQSIGSGDNYGIGLALEYMADSVGHIKVDWKDKIVEASIQAYKVATLDHFPVENVKEKLKIDFAPVSISLSEIYRTSPPTVISFAKEAFEIKTKIDNGEYIGQSCF